MITSLTSPKIARVRRLLETHSSRDRKAVGHFVVEGLRAVEGVLATRDASSVEIYCTAEWLHRFPGAVEVSEEVAKKVSDTVTSQGIFGVVPLDVETIDLSKSRRVAIFLELQDPGNAGTIIRSAHAFGIDAVVFSKGSVDPFSGKVVRSSAGSIAAIPILFGEESHEIIESLLTTHHVVAFDMTGTDIDQAELSEPLLMIFGNEARGLPDHILANGAIVKVRIPMSPGIESLNVASAATVAMYETSRRDRN